MGSERERIEGPKEGREAVPKPTSRCGDKKGASATPKNKPGDVKDDIFASKGITTGTKGGAEGIKGRVRGAKELDLVMADGGGGQSCDWADWAEPRLVDAQGKETKLTDLKWKSASAKELSWWGRIGINKNCGGKPLKINGKPVAYGIGAHANSVIHYELPKGHQ